MLSDRKGSRTSDEVVPVNERIMTCPVLTLSQFPSTLPDSQQLAQSESCGGYDAFDLFLIPPVEPIEVCSGDMVEAYEEVRVCPGFQDFSDVVFRLA